MKNKNLIYIILSLFMLVSISCNDATDINSTKRQAGWTEETHSKSAIRNYSLVFAQDNVNRIDITISTTNWDAMMNNMQDIYGPFGRHGRPGLENAENPIWKPCTLEFNGIEWWHVGIRFKGNSSLRDTWQRGIYKLPFRLDFDQFEDTYPSILNQRFYGFKKLTFSSGYKDSSLMRDKVAADIFRAAGVPAPYTSFYRVYINNGSETKYFGLYALVEVPGEPMFEKQFQSNDGNLYKPDGEGATFDTFDPTTFKNNIDEDLADWSDITSLFSALHADRTDVATWRTRLEKILNVDGFLRWLAVNTVIQNWDTIGNKTHNFYLYNNNGILNWIPWDNNESLKSSDQNTLSLGMAEVEDDWPIINYIVNDDVYYSKYTNYLNATISNAFYPANAKARYKHAYNLIKDYVVGEHGEIPGYTFLSNIAEFETGYAYLNTHVDIRYQAVTNFLSP